ncbi:MAG: DUF2125 domain-containing protein [Alphaproteobacteria bacterium]|nr:DUF2125 domain-containing protein [Alphaproteobacteria bacterium]
MRTVQLTGAVAGGIAIAAAGYTAYWYLAADAIENRVADWSETQREYGWQLEAADTDVSGFPTRFSVTLRDPIVTAAADGWSWHGENLLAEMRPWNFKKITLHVNGKSQVRIKDGALWRDIDVQVEDGQAKLVLTDDRRVKDIALDMTSVRVEGLLAGGPASARRVRAQSLLSPAPEGGSAAAQLDSEVIKAALNLEQVELPEDVSEGLGTQIEHLTLEASLVGPMPGEAKRDAVMAWRDAGGTIELNSLDLRWGPLGLSTNGTLALDKELRPMGALTADIVGYGDVIDALIMSDVIPLGDAFMAKVAFNVMAEKSTNGGPPILRRIPLTAQGGDLFVGPVAFAKLPPLNIPQ